VQFLYANSTTIVTLLFRLPGVRHLPRQELKFPRAYNPQYLLTGRAKTQQNGQLALVFCVRELLLGS